MSEYNLHGGVYTNTKQTILNKSVRVIHWTTEIKTVLNALPLYDEIKVLNETREATDYMSRSPSSICLGYILIQDNIMNS